MIDITRIIFDKEIREKYHTKFISGSDEAGRGAMAGPIVVASVILPETYANPLINDSKKINEKLREKLFVEIKQAAISYDIQILSNQQVDLLNPKQSSRIGMINSIKKLKVKPDVSLIDAEKILIENYNCLAFIKGDFLSQSIAAASILAKVTRDNIMKEMSVKYPNYNLDVNKGYCTLDHQNRLKQFGVTDIHRKTYKPVKDLL